MWRLLLLVVAVINVDGKRPYHPSLPLCSRNCPPVDCQPVCANCPKSGEVTFGSDCELDCQNELYPNNQCVKLHDGQCGTCDIACEEVYSPVCALCANNTETTFGNYCELNRQTTCDPTNQCTLLHDGPCGKQPICDVFCEKVYKPVCALCEDGENTFGNECELIRRNTCEPSNQCTKIFDGACGRQCDIFCPNIYQPICAQCDLSGERTFGNDCELNGHNTCNPSDQCTKISQGECTPNPTCTIACTLEYAPVCALCSDGNRTFGNDCAFNAYNTCNPNDQCTQIRRGDCGQTCDIFCPAVFDPVCALCSDGNRTFGNNCELDRQNACNPSDQCTYISAGDCSPRCEIICPLLYQPVCALCNDGTRTFGNSCELDRQNACNPSDLCSKISDGECTSQCDIACPAIYQPICARCDQSGERTLGNDCELNRQNACNPSDQCTKISQGECTPNPPCLIACTREYDPVCALCSDGNRTFGNNCTFNAHNSCIPSDQCTKISDGECGQSCDIVCLPVYDEPVCASCKYGNRTFANSCELERQNTCNSSEQCTKIRDGECSQSCNTVCPFVYQPICALCNDGERSFGSNCELTWQNNCNPSDQCTLLYDGECNYGNPCTDIDKPVCAQCPSGNRTFRNVCYLGQHNNATGEGCSYVQEGPCQQPKSCARPCPLYDIEVCAICNGRNFRTFPNTCLMGIYNCQNDDNCRSISEGVGKPCPPPHPPPSPSSPLCDGIYCPAIREPVCAQCGADTITFQNGCALGIHNCKYDHECVRISEGVCPCPPEESSGPLCATCSNGLRTFQNKCIFDAYKALYSEDNCTKQYDGKCRIECPLYSCLVDYNAPICALCGIEERTFYNECIFNSFNCPAGLECSKLHDGACETVNPGGPICPSVCTREYKPVCAQCPSGPQTFNNLCLLQNNNCLSRPGCTFLRDGTCETVNPGGPICPISCTREYQPVCAQCPNGEQTFNNLCLLQQNNCQSDARCSYVRDGVCTLDPCSRSCPSNGTPVCAVCADKYKTFSSTCEMEKFNCLTNGNCQYVSNDSRSCPPVQPGDPLVDPVPPGFPTSPSECAAISCSTELQPVCARCGPTGTLQTFVNGCLFGIYNCFNNQECTKIYDGECQQTPKPIICSIQWNPVCANCSSGPRTFQNECFFNAYTILNPQEKCTKSHAGTCRTTCPLYKCSNIQQPICALCGFEQRTFDNECYFNSYNCPAGFECIKIKDGPCSSLPPLICSAEFEPICASCSYGFATFANACFMRAENKANPNSRCVQRMKGPCSAVNAGIKYVQL